MKTETEPKTASELVKDACNGCGPLSRLTREDLIKLVALFSPYGVSARDQLFREMREQADDSVPCQYE